ncbi:adenine-specific DNA-methyltransferase [Pseudorhodobacter antarcticus]|uniref:site-specific DNA-methyltransferase (adenine-specific) n=1 Tax=Pseudorhodobacter antarcticus TaxID=1077947 RepID=A0A1H8KHV5_9RHOB|nr:site-specific DNA-methyltransferase [Pseudorhodobacter antarcticus]SEN92492.1 adenine-specific DNA-methyltransferase [Pseudorhodobacter antarcticus]
MSNFDALVAKLREIFQIDRPDLDFGVYRILNARAGEIEDYLSKRLKARVAEALAAGAAANTETLKAAIAKARESAEAAGYNPDEAPKVLSLQKELAAASTGASEHENQVFSHLLTFFSRYYDKGDFISQRRYKGDTYAIPYSGEEVVLHWANRDQYYTKSGESFSNFSFKLDDGRVVHFRLVAADTAKDNRKDNDKERRFVLAAARTVTRTDEDGETYEETIHPVAEEDGALVIRFDFAAQPKGTKQEALVDKAVEAILDDEAVKARWLALTNRAPTEKNPKRTLLEKHLTTYTQKNTADYFIHKDLGGFLRRELDFYIKNEVMNLDDVQEAGTFADIEKNLRMIQCLRAIALDLTTFLASIEDFQKKLWLKRKFVVAAQYCVTLDRVSPALYPVIAANPAQWAQWHELGMRASAAAGTVEDLKAAPFLMVDTALFDAGFRADLLKAIPDLDASLDGLLVHGDNFQALGLLGLRYREQVKCVYIDPPYNTGNDGFVYKDGYSHSAWLSMMHQLTEKSGRTLSNGAVHFASCDDNEASRFKLLLDAKFGHELMEAQIGVQSNKRGQTYKSIAKTHEYLFAYGCDETSTLNGLPRNLEGGETDEFGNFELWELRNRNPKFGRFNRPNLFYSFFASPNQQKRLGFSEVRLERDAEYTAEVLPFNSSGVESCWRWGTIKAKAGSIKGAEILIAKTTRSGEWRIFEKARKTTKAPKSIWDDTAFINEQGTVRLGALGFTDFGFPKPVRLIQTVVQIGTNADDLVLDYFAGSGTTGEAVLAQCRDDEIQRRYILVEHGPYFPTVLKPRIQKVVYSAEWKDGKPTAPETGISHAFKVLKIEGYEDALNNLDLKRSAPQASLLEGFSAEKRDDYLMRYMLDVEAKGSLLSVDDFQKPFNYSLRIAVDSAGAWEERKVDLVETFNYLIGLTVRHVDIQLKQGFVTVEGTLPSGEKTLILWRDCEKIGYEELTWLCDKLAINPADSEFDVVYINGDHNIPSVVETSEAEGSLVKKLMLRQIEPAFLDAMFNVDDV